ncbi:hypothetical protein AMK22_11630 [Streptomyces sp. CB01580]|nr:hypothetical protein AMK22_11630 [Streptomyces sp. CB01580]
MVPEVRPRDWAEFLTADWDLAATASDRFADELGTGERGTRHTVRITLATAHPSRGPERPGPFGRRERPGRCRRPPPTG